MSTKFASRTVQTAENVVTEGFATVPEGAKLLRLSRATMYGVMDAGDLAYAKFGRSRRIPWRAIREFAERGMVAR
jgi:excisionase family DNA binding protein